MKLTTRQWNLYKFLLTEPERWFTQKEICDHVEGYTYRDRKNDKCPMIREDKIAINGSFEVDKVIVTKNYCFKIATNPLEAEIESQRHLNRLIAQAKQIQAINKKIARNGQGKLLSNQGNPIDDKSLAKEFYEAFLND